MIISAVKYPSINTKIYGMYEHKLKKNEIDELLKQHTITQAIALLKSIDDNFNALDENSDRIKIKICLDNLLIKDIKKIYRLLNNNEKAFLKAFISSYEIKCIKSVLRKLYTKSSIDNENNDIENWVNNIFPELVGLENVKDYEEFLEIIKKTKYYKIFKNYEEISDINIFKIENDLDKVYFENIFNLSLNKPVKDMLGKNIDLSNINWIYRLKKYYNFSEEDIENSLIKIYYKLTKNEILKMVQADSEKQLMDILNLSYYSKYINFENIEDIEESIDKYLYALYKKYFKSNILKNEIVYAYINLIERENNDVMNIIEGIRYKMDISEIRKKLVVI